MLMSWSTETKPMISDTVEENQRCSAVWMDIRLNRAPDVGNPKGKVCQHFCI